MLRWPVETHHVREPIENVCCAFFPYIGSNACYCHSDLLLNYSFPLGNGILGERVGEELSTCCMYFWLPHGEYPFICFFELF